jgi:putative ABC transport system permease protein
MNIFRDLRHALRRWRSRPAFAATAILTLALGIASTTAIFSVVDAVLLKPLPWRDPDRLVAVYVQRPLWLKTPVLAGSWNTGNLSWPIWEDLRTKSRTLSEVATWNRTRPTLNGERNEIVYGLQTMSSFFPMLGVSPFMGRFFTSQDDSAPTTSVIVSYEAWQRRFGGRPDVLGQRVSLNETPFVIVGVLPPGFDFLGINPAEFVMPWGNTPIADRHPGNHFMYGIARLRPGVTLADAIVDSDPLVRGTEKPEEKQARLIPLSEDQRGQTRRPLLFLLIAAALLLLIACANVAGLLIGEAGSRRYEIAVRLAIGGSRRAIARQMLVENVALAIAATVMALVLVAWLTPLLGLLTPSQLPRAGEISVSPRVFGFGVLLGLLTSIVFSVAPALSFTRVDPVQWMHGGGRGASRKRYGVHNFVVVAEVALAVILVAAASLFSESLLRLTGEQVGFRPENLIVASVRVARDPSITAPARVARNDALVSQLAALPGIEAATLTSTAPFSGSYGSNGITINDKGGMRADANRHIVGDSYFRTIGIPVIKGRGFEPTDQAGDFVAVVTEEFERRYLDGSAVGKRFTLNKDLLTVVGVVPATKHRRYSDDVAPAFYALNRQLPTWATPQFIVRSSIDGAAMLAAVRKTIEAADPLASITTLETMRDMMRRTVAEERYRATLALIFGATGLLLAAMGLYGLIARGVADRQREIGVRVALGAQRNAVVALVLRQTLGLVAIGLFAGVAMSLAGSDLVATLLYGVTATTPHIFVVAIVLLGATALAAAIVPARRATRIDPVIALRTE